MKRVLFWFFWLQIGMPYCMAVGFCAVAGMSHGDFLTGIVMSPLVALLGVFIFAPYLFANTLVCALIILSAQDLRTTRLILSFDVAAAFLFFAVGSSVIPRPLWLSLCFVLWWAIGALLIVKVPRCEPT